MGVAAPGLLGHTGVPVQPPAASPTEWAEVKAQNDHMRKLAIYAGIFGRLEQDWHCIYNSYRGEGLPDAEACLYAWNSYRTDLISGEAGRWMRHGCDPEFVFIWNAQLEPVESMQERARQGNGSHNPQNTEYHRGEPVSAASMCLDVGVSEEENGGMVDLEEFLERRLLRHEGASMEDGMEGSGGDGLDE